MKREMQGIQYTLLLLSIGGAFIWILVADNLVRAFGLAGALSLIRFRTVVKDPSNTIKVFYAAIIGTIFMCFVLTLIYYIHEHNKKLKKLSQQSASEDEADALEDEEI